MHKIKITYKYAGDATKKTVTYAYNRETSYVDLLHSILVELSDYNEPLIYFRFVPVEK